MSYKIIEIDGYYNDNGQKFQNYKCAVGDWDDSYTGTDLDQNTFFWFDNMEQARARMGENVGGEFTITAIHE